MITARAVRELALALPEAEERDHFGRPSFRVRNKIFATLWEDEGRTVLKLPLEQQTALATSAPETFSLTGWEHQGWTSVKLSNINAEKLQTLILVAWRNVAPKRLIAAYDGSSN